MKKIKIEDAVGMVLGHDLIFPRILAGEMITKKDIGLLGHGGFCQNCDPCHFPFCPFGKG